MKKLSVFVLIFAQLTVSIPFSSNTAYAATPVPITAPSAILIDTATQRVVYSKTPHLKRAPASTTKILTSIVAAEQLGLNEVVTVPSFVTSIEPSKIYLKPGDRYYVRDLIKATLISSANDAAETLAHAAGGSRPKFAVLMNAKAKQLGAVHSNFVRASGLPAENQYSTAYDMALIMKEANSNPYLVEVMKIKNTSIKSLSGRRTLLRNHNKMLWRDPREVVGKTGWTRNARHCFVGQIRAYGRTVFVAMLGSRKLWTDLKKLVDFEFGKAVSKPRATKKSAAIPTKSIQSALKKAGYFKGPVNGRYGKMTKSAVKKFQKSQGLRADGIVGSATWAKLKAFS